MIKRSVTITETRDCTQSRSLTVDVELDLPDDADDRAIVSAIQELDIAKFDRMMQEADPEWEDGDPAEPDFLQVNDDHSETICMELFK